MAAKPAASCSSRSAPCRSAARVSFVATARRSRSCTRRRIASVAFFPLGLTCATATSPSRSSASSSSPIAARNASGSPRPCAFSTFSAASPRPRQPSAGRARRDSPRARPPTASVAQRPLRPRRTGPRRAAALRAGSAPRRTRPARRRRASPTPAAGSRPSTLPRPASTLRRSGALAQLGERRLCKPEVTGSIPVRSMALRGRFSLPRTACAGNARLTSAARKPRH